MAHAAAASSSVPGIFSPQPILDRRCMDGGVSGSGINSDVVAGAERVVILALATLGANDVTLYDGAWSEWGARDDLPVEPAK